MTNSNRIKLVAWSTNAILTITTGYSQVAHCLTTITKFQCLPLYSPQCMSKCALKMSKTLGVTLKTYVLFFIIRFHNIFGAYVLNWQISLAWNTLLYNSWLNSDKTHKVFVNFTLITILSSSNVVSIHFFNSLELKALDTKNNSALLILIKFWLKRYINWAMRAIRLNLSFLVPSHLYKLML